MAQLFSSLINVMTSTLSGNHLLSWLMVIRDTFEGVRGRQQRVTWYQLINQLCAMTPSWCSEGQLENAFGIEWVIILLTQCAWDIWGLDGRYQQILNCVTECNRPIGKISHPKVRSQSVASIIQKSTSQCYSIILYLLTITPVLVT